MSPEKRRKFGHLCNAFLAQASADGVLFDADFFAVLDNIAKENFKTRIKAEQRDIEGTVLSFEKRE